MKSVEFTIEAINISLEKGTVKTPVETAEINDLGIKTDAHAGPWHRQISLLAAEDVERFEASIDRKLNWGEFAENLTTRGIDLGKVAVFDRIKLGDVELEITQIGKACHHGCDIFKQVGACIMPKQGLFARVVSGGPIHAGMSGTWTPRAMCIHVLTISDRAAHGVYSDRSGPAIAEQLQEHFASRRDHLKLTSAIIPDDPEQVKTALNACIDAGTDLVITSGGTGLGPRDFTPEVTADILDRILPGLMEQIRWKYGKDKPGAYLSRGYCGTCKKTFIINMPGSVRAVKEYTTELLVSWDHIRRMIHAIDHH